MLTIENLVVNVEDKEIIKNLSLTINPGEVHAIMGTNGSGKSTLANTLSGKEGYEPTSGKVLFNGENLLELDPEIRAQKGVFMAFQYPVELPGVRSSYFLRTSFNCKRKANNEPELGVREFNKLLESKAALLGISEDFFARSLNEGFSGGEKKRNEVLQMLLLEPKLAILDETDSGLDIDALKVVAAGVNALKQERPDTGILLITHYQRLLNYIKPDFVHVMIDGRIVKSGDATLAHQLEERGYNWLKENAPL